MKGKDLTVGSGWRKKMREKNGDASSSPSAFQYIDASSRRPLLSLHPQRVVVSGERGLLEETTIAPTLPPPRNHTPPVNK